MYLPLPTSTYGALSGFCVAIPSICGSFWDGVETASSALAGAKQATADSRSTRLGIRPLIDLRRMTGGGPHRDVDAEQYLSRNILAGRTSFVTEKFGDRGEC